MEWSGATINVPTIADVVNAPYTLLADIFQKQVSAVRAEQLSGGLSGRCDRLYLCFTDGNSTVAVLKTHTGGESAVNLGLAREAYAYNILSPKLRSIGCNIPVVYFAVGDMTTGRKMLLLADGGEAIDSGLCFGMGTPLNWRRADAVAAAASIASPEEAARSAFAHAARWHAAFWRDMDTVASAPWLRGSGRLRGEGRADWEAAQAHAANFWAATERGEGPAAGVEWDPAVVAVIRASIKKTSWADAQQSLHSAPWTIVHGDFHPGNALVARRATTFDDNNSSDVQTLLVDLEVVGVGSGPQELAQYCISHMAPALRRGCERRLVKEYHDTLIASGVPAVDMSFDACWAEYIAGGAARWVWLVALLSGMCDAPSVTYWAQQLGAFLADHGVNAENIGQPRV